MKKHTPPASPDDAAGELVPEQNTPTHKTTMHTTAGGSCVIEPTEQTTEEKDNAKKS